MICSKCGLEVEKEWEGGWKCTEDRRDYYAHHMCPVEKDAIWTYWETRRAVWALGKAEEMLDAESTT